METDTLRAQACEEAQGEEAIHTPRMSAATRPWETDLEQTPPVPSAEQVMSTPRFWTPGLQGCESNLVVLRHPVCCALLSQP